MLATIHNSERRPNSPNPKVPKYRTLPPGRLVDHLGRAFLGVWDLTKRRFRHRAFVGPQL